MTAKMHILTKVSIYLSVYLLMQRALWQGVDASHVAFY